MIRRILHRLLLGKAVCRSVDATAYHLARCLHHLGES